jgi:hypothetical protein
MRKRDRAYIIHLSEVGTLEHRELIQNAHIREQMSRDDMPHIEVIQHVITARASIHVLERIAGAYLPVRCQARVNLLKLFQSIRIHDA